MQKRKPIGSRRYSNLEKSEGESRGSLRTHCIFLVYDDYCAAMLWGELCI